jgi:predicted nucleic acid-binding protein
MNSEFKDILRRIKPDKRREQLRPRPKSQLRFIGPSWNRHARLLYDTTVYIDILQERFPVDAELVLRAAEAWHSTVTGAELASLCGQLDPGHSGTRAVIEQIAAIIGRRPAHRTITPDRQIWLDAGVLAGTLGRLQQYGPADRRRVLNDALLFSTARKHGLTVLTRNFGDFDLLQQIDPAGRVLFYSI